MHAPSRQTRSRRLHPRVTPRGSGLINASFTSSSATSPRSASSHERDTHHTCELHRLFKPTCAANSTRRHRPSCATSSVSTASFTSASFTSATCALQAARCQQAQQAGTRHACGQRAQHAATRPTCINRHNMQPPGQHAATRPSMQPPGRHTVLGTACRHQASVQPTGTACSHQANMQPEAQHAPSR